MLVELSTSEGRRSGPPADHRLSALGKGPAVPARVVPIAWHVDYWDTIGWKDRFAQAGCSVHQRELAQIRRAPVVHTPQVLVQGQDFRRGSGGGLEDAVIQRHRLALPRAVAPGASGVVACVQSTRAAEVLQALALPACPG